MTSPSSGDTALIILCLFIVGPFLLGASVLTNLGYPEIAKIMWIALGLILFSKILIGVGGSRL